MELLNSRVIRDEEKTQFIILIGGLENIDNIEETQLGNLSFSINNGSLYIVDTVYGQHFMEDSDDLNIKLTYLHFLAQLKKLRLDDKLPPELQNLLDYLSNSGTVLFNVDPENKNGQLNGTVRFDQSDEEELNEEFSDADELDEDEDDQLYDEIDNADDDSEKDDNNS